MCGRFGLHHSWQTTSSFLFDQFKVEFDETKLSLPLYNIAPTQQVLILIHDGAQYRVGLSTWGFSLSSTNSKPVINARSESVFETTLFRQSIRTKRCLILASGFYEWQRITTPSQPSWFYDQIKPFYTNMKGENVLGLFSSRATVNSNQIQFSKATNDSILFGSYTKALKFVGISSK